MSLRGSTLASGSRDSYTAYGRAGDVQRSPEAEAGSSSRAPRSSGWSRSAPSKGFTRSNWEIVQESPVAAVSDASATVAVGTPATDRDNHRSKRSRNESPAAPVSAKGKERSLTLPRSDSEEEDKPIRGSRTSSSREQGSSSRARPRSRSRSPPRNVASLPSRYTNARDEDNRDRNLGERRRKRDREGRTATPETDRTQRSPRDRKRDDGRQLHYPQNRDNGWKRNPPDESKDTTTSDVQDPSTDGVQAKTSRWNVRSHEGPEQQESPNNQNSFGQGDQNPVDPSERVSEQPQPVPIPVLHPSSLRARPSHKALFRTRSPSPAGDRAYRFRFILPTPALIDFLIGSSGWRAKEIKTFSGLIRLTFAHSDEFDAPLGELIGSKASIYEAVQTIAWHIECEMDYFSMGMRELVGNVREWAVYGEEFLEDVGMSKKALRISMAADRSKDIKEIISASAPVSVLSPKQDHSPGGMQELLPDPDSFIVDPRLKGDRANGRTLDLEQNHSFQPTMHTVPAGGSEPPLNEVSNSPSALPLLFTTSSNPIDPTAILTIPRFAVRHIIGAGGQNIKRLTKILGGRITIVNKEDDNLLERQVHIWGDPNQINIVVAEIERIIVDCRPWDYGRPHETRRRQDVQTRLMSQPDRGQENNMFPRKDEWDDETVPVLPIALHMSRDHSTNIQVSNDIARPSSIPVGSRLGSTHSSTSSSTISAPSFEQVQTRTPASLSHTSPITPLLEDRRTPYSNIEEEKSSRMIVDDLAPSHDIAINENGAQAIVAAVAQQSEKASIPVDQLLDIIGDLDSSAADLVLKTLLKRKVAGLAGGARNTISSSAAGQMPLLSSSTQVTQFPATSLPALKVLSNEDASTPTLQTPLNTVSTPSIRSELQEQRGFKEKDNIALANMVPETTAETPYLAPTASSSPINDSVTGTQDEGASLVFHTVPATLPTRSSVGDSIHTVGSLPNYGIRRRPTHDTAQTALTTAVSVSSIPPSHHSRTSAVSSASPGRSRQVPKSQALTTTSSSPSTSQTRCTSTDEMMKEYIVTSPPTPFSSSAPTSVLTQEVAPTLDTKPTLVTTFDAREDEEEEEEDEVLLIPLPRSARPRNAGPVIPFPSSVLTVSPRSSRPPPTKATPFAIPVHSPRNTIQSREEETKSKPSANGQSAYKGPFAFPFQAPTKLKRNVVLELQAKRP